MTLKPKLDLLQDSVNGTAAEKLKVLAKAGGLDFGQTSFSALEAVSSGARLNRLAGILNPETRLIDHFSSLERLLQSPALDAAQEALRNSFEQISLRTLDVDDALSHIAPTPDWRTSEPIFAQLPPNPIYETNRELAELTGTVTQLVEVARQQAELTQAINKTSTLALESAIQSSAEAKSATDLARKSLKLTRWAIIINIVIAILGIVFTALENRPPVNAAPSYLVNFGN